MKLLYLFIGLFLINQFILVAQKSNYYQSQKRQPVFQVDYPNPTADKPQSKLWYMDKSWWTILPKANGPSLWQRTDNGWIEHKEINTKLNGVPGRADVYADNHTITAVGVAPQQLVVFRIKQEKNRMDEKWNVEKLASFSFTKDESVETATITSDKNGCFWVSAICGDKVCVWSCDNGNKHWNGPFVLCEGIYKDDICTVTAIPEGIGVIWSDQINEAVKIRVHQNGQPFDNWRKETIIEQGNKTADDHLNTAISKDGTLWLTTKNSLDTFGKPQFVLRVRTPDGKWRNYPYCNLQQVEQPSRPVILTVEGDPSLILNGYTIYNYQNKYLGKILFGKMDTTKENIIQQVTPVIIPDTTNWTGKNLINNITACKSPLPKNVPWIILASDNKGHVYEADLSLFFK